jgi:hypothetical protein
LRLPIQFFVHSNNGYGSIKAMQMARFDGHVVGADPESGFTIPRLAEVAECFGMDCQHIRSADGFIQRVKIYDHVLTPDEILADYKDNWNRNRITVDFTGQLIELMVDPDYIQLPRVATSLVNGKWQQDSMEDMTPKIDDLQELMEW